MREEGRLRAESVLKPGGPFADDALQLGGRLGRLQSDGGERRQARNDLRQLRDLRGGSDDRFAREKEDLIERNEQESVLGVSVR